MINVVKEIKDNVLHVRLIGPIGEDTPFEKLIGETPAEVVINCREITRINSVGVKAWIKYFQSLKAKNIKITFASCSVAIVEQMNLISNFLAGAKVESIFVPFACEKCKLELVGLFLISDLEKLKMNFPPLKCTKCGGQAVFDDIPEEYLAFMSR